LTVARDRSEAVDCAQIFRFFPPPLIEGQQGSKGRQPFGNCVKKKPWARDTRARNIMSEGNDQ